MRTDQDLQGAPGAEGCPFGSGYPGLASASYVVAGGAVAAWVLLHGQDLTATKAMRFTATSTEKGRGR